MIANRFNPLGVRAKPYAYEVEYLESTGTQYLGTGVIPSNTIRMEILAQYTRVDKNQTLVAAGNDSETSYSHNVFINTNLGGFGLQYGKPFATFGTKDTNKHLFVVDWVARTFSIDSSVYSLESPRIGNTIPWEYYMFQINGSAVGSALATRWTWAKMFSCKLYDGGVLLRDFIPVVDYNGVACMYDKVSEQLFYNKGTGEFTAGQRI